MTRHTQAQKLSRLLSRQARRRTPLLGHLALLRAEQLSDRKMRSELLRIAASSASSRTVRREASLLAAADLITNDHEFSDYCKECQDASDAQFDGGLLNGLEELARQRGIGI